MTPTRVFVPPPTIYWRMQVFVEVPSRRNTASGARRKTEAQRGHEDMGPKRMDFGT
uniref:Uncharacterized protein n=1 Tax=Hyaloperonospora arabidopsidis (strain Emoy2) TaxID=559515 RepID=M4C0U9_HYAAE